MLTWLEFSFFSLFFLFILSIIRLLSSKQRYTSPMQWVIRQVLGFEYVNVNDSIKNFNDIIIIRWRQIFEYNVPKVRPGPGTTSRRQMLWSALWFRIVDEFAGICHPRRSWFKKYARSKPFISECNVPCTAVYMSVWCLVLLSMWLFGKQYNCP